MNYSKEYVNISEIARQSNKLLQDWTNRPVGRKKIAAFRESHPEISQPIISKRGKGGGTYAHPELAAIFAVWCNPALPADHHKLIKMAAEKILELESTSGESKQLEAVVAISIPNLMHVLKLLTADELIYQAEVEVIEAKLRTISEKILGCSLEEANIKLEQVDPGYPRLKETEQVLAILTEINLWNAFEGVKLETLVESLGKIDRLIDCFGYKSPSELLLDAQSAMQDPDKILSRLELIAEGTFVGMYFFNPDIEQMPRSNRALLASAN
jgi:KilA-N domain